MIVSFQLWKIILGIFISAFLIVFAVGFIGDYIEQQNDILRAKIMNNFEIGAYEVYSSGNSLEFNDMSKVPFDLRFTAKNEPGYIIPSLGKKTLRVPVFFSPGDKMFISRAETDLGWWSFRYVVAMPETEIVVSMTQNSQEAWNILKNTINALPDTTNFENKITYAFCYGNQIERNFCGRDGKSPCEAKTILEAMDSGGLPVHFSKCTDDLNRNQRLLTIGSCTGTEDGVCVETNGKAHLSGSQTVFQCTDSLDVAVLVIGYTKKDVYGLWGENFYEYKNIELKRELALASKIVSSRSQILSNEINRLVGTGELDEDAGEVECADLFLRLAGAAEAMNIIVDGDSEQLSNIITESSDIKKQLVDRGCDYA